ncbi:FkbM family methyltransferase [Luminiphilus sp.]|nr:FkbM family methyltransferase [Luminiphilus sp.]
MLAWLRALFAESPLQLYRGYEPADIDLVRRYTTARAALHDDHYVDGFGVKTSYACVPFEDPATFSARRLQSPFPDDSFHAEGIEYVALVDAIDRFSGDDTFCAVEAGAGWGPWLAMAGVVCRSQKVEKIRLIGLEASAKRFALMAEHLEFNELDAEHGVAVELFEGAVWSHDGVIYFPDSDLADMGAAASAASISRDYRGHAVSTREVPCTRLSSLVGDDSEVDFLHVDVQGAEGNVIASHLEWLNRSVKSLMVATHSRPLEGELMTLLNAHDWVLMREKPCRFDAGKVMEDWCGATTADGSQYWINGKFTEIASNGRQYD